MLGTKRASLAGVALLAVAFGVYLWAAEKPSPEDRRDRAAKAQQAGNDNVVRSHDNYWGSEAAMEEGNPPLALERGEAVELPPTLVIQRKVDSAHPLEMQQRLVEWYRKRGGQIEMPLFDTIPTPFKISEEFPETATVVETIADFIVAQAR